MDQAANDMLNLLYTIPNIPYDSVPEECWCRGQCS